MPYEIPSANEPSFTDPPRFQNQQNPVKIIIADTPSLAIKGIAARLLLLLICQAFYCRAQQSRDVFISGKLVNLNNRTSVIDLSETAALRPYNNEREIAPDSTGNFSVHFKLKEANYFLIGRNVVYLSPGDRLKVMIDYRQPTQSTFLGKGSIANYYLASTPFSHAGSYLEGGANLKPTLQQSINFILFLAQERRNKLATLHSITPEFVNLENGRIYADIINSFRLLAGYFINANKISKQNQLKVSKEADSLTRPLINKYCLNLHKASLLKIEVVRDDFYIIMDGVTATDANTSRIKDWQYAYELVYYINTDNDKTDLLKTKVKIDSIKNTGYRNAAKESFDQRAGFWNGDTAIDFQAHDVNNQAISLSSFKGKIIYIDLWATWCVPCLKELPFLDSLRTKYSNNPDIVFISLCLNQNPLDWKESLRKRRSEGIQLCADQRQMLPYKISAIPRTIIIDKNFKVLMMTGPLPSNTGLQGYLDNLLKTM